MRASKPTASTGSTESTTIDTTLGEYMAAVYAELLEAYGDADLASVATAAMVNDLLAADRLPKNTPIAA